MKSLKGNHFSNYLFHLMMTTYNDYLANQNENDLNLNISKTKKEYSDPNNNPNIKNEKIQKEKKRYIVRKFKSPKNLDYHFKYKAPQFNNYTKRNLINDNEKTEEFYSLNIITNRTEKNKEIDIQKSEFEYNVKYDPIKISNNFIKFNAGKEYSKLSQKLEMINKKENKKEINNKAKIKLAKNKIKNGIIEGYFGRKIKRDIPVLFDISSTFYNYYSNKSEKSRHEVVLNELNRLKGFILNDPKNTIQIFKNFLIRFNYKNIEKLSDEQILSICDFICLNDNDILFHLIKPYYKSKDIVTKMINNLINITKDKKSIILDKKTDKIDSQDSINQNVSSLLKTKLNKNKNPLSSKNLIKSKKLSKTQNYFYNKMMRETYQSPFYIPFKSHRAIENNNLKKNFVDLSETNSLLKFLNYQKKIQLPDKHYSLENNLLINEISKEIRELKNNFDKTVTNNQFKKNSLLKKKGISYSSSLYNKKINSKFLINEDKNIFSKTSIQFNNILKQIKKGNIKPKMNIILLNNKNLEKLKNMIAYSKTIDKKADKNKEKNLNKINERMYYKAINYEFGYKQIKDLYKITEVAALNFAKKKKFDKMKLDLLK